MCNKDSILPTVPWSGFLDILAPNTGDLQDLVLVETYMTEEEISTLEMADPIMSNDVGIRGVPPYLDHRKQVFSPCKSQNP